MPVAPYCPSSSQDLQAVHQFITTCLPQVAQSNPAQLVSITLAVPTVDPLLVLAHLAHSPDVHFYVENAATQTAAVALGSVLNYQIVGADRFAQARRFIDAWGCQTQHYQAPEVPIVALGRTSLPRFFCSFTFFAQGSHGCIGFPGATVVLPQWQLLRQGNRCTLTLNVRLTPSTAPAAVLSDLETCIQAIDRLSQQQWPSPLPLRPQPIEPTAQAESQFKAAVATALGHIARHKLQKIVLAHAFDWVRTEPFQPLPSLGQLRQRYPDCYVFSVGNGQGQRFMGASPERLLSVRQGNLITDALAGSAPRGYSPHADRQLALQLLRSPKEQGEHRLVVEFLAQKLMDLGLHPTYPKAPTLRRLSNIQHLHTPIQARLSVDTHPLQLVEALHPTPAVAGVPTYDACEQIHRFESFDRGLYAAPLGWIGANGDSEFIVGIRSALIDHNWARLYAGAGIVAGSNPTREWAEIQLKFRALGEALL